MIEGHSRPVTSVRARRSTREEVGGAGGGRDCNLTPSSPWHQDHAVLGLSHQRQMTLHQQEVISTFNNQLSITQTFLRITQS